MKNLVSSRLKKVLNLSNSSRIKLMISVQLCLDLFYSARVECIVTDPFKRWTNLTDGLTDASSD